MIENVWKNFCNKMKQNQLCENDFVDEMRLFLSPVLCGSDAGGRREKFSSAAYEIFPYETKLSVLLHCPDDEYRFDFVRVENEWKLQFIECITLPLSDISVLPYMDFKALPGKETDIRSEKAISRLIYFYNEFKKVIGKERAAAMLHDGAGEFLGAKSWVPFFSERLSYVAYAAWMESRIQGEHVKILEFAEERCCLCFQQHIWRRMYQMTGHLQKMIDYEEYMGIFESIWENRAAESGWKILFHYGNEDTELIFLKP